MSFPARRHDIVAPQFERALALHRDGRFDEAAHGYAVVLRTVPDHIPALCCLSLCQGARGMAGQALRVGVRVAALAPDCAEAWNSLGNAYAAQGASAQAATAFRRMLGVRPTFAEGHNNLGNALQALERPAAAAARFRAAIALKPDFSYAYNNLGSSDQACDRIADAAVHFHRATRLAPDDPVAHHNEGIARTEIGDLDRAYTAFETAVERAPRHGAFHRALADTGRIAADSPSARRMEDLLEPAAGLPEPDRMELHFALGRVYADDGQSARAFRHLEAGNRLKRRSIAYDEAASLAGSARIEATFTAEALASGGGCPSGLPVFVVGMPRSGTTLVEQILASHPDVFGAGELLDLRRVAESVMTFDGRPGFPDGVVALTGDQRHTLGRAYVEGIAARAPAATRPALARIVDKMPSNFKLIGLIALILPNARIIHVRRDPIDTCLSCYARVFAGPQPFAYDLGELGRYHRAYEHMMAHWRRILPPDRMLEVRYEDIVTDVETEARRLVAHLGLAWDARCLAFHETGRIVRTASAAQVRRPLYTDSIGRWRALGAQLQPLRDALGP